MNVRPLIIDDGARAMVKRVLAHAEAHHYRPGPGAAPPGDDPRFVAHLGTYRAVFSFTHADGLIYRHLSVSVPGAEGGKFPNPIAAFLIADLFGLTGYAQDMADQPPGDWLAHVNGDEHCIIIAQAIASDMAREKMA